MPVDPKTGKEYPYTDEGIAQHKKDTGGMPMKSSGFKMRSGNATPFKQMGSTPAKGIVSKLVGAGAKKAIGKAGLNVGPGMPLTESPTKQPNFNWTGSSAETEKFGKYQNQPKPKTGIQTHWDSGEKVPKGVTYEKVRPDFDPNLKTESKVKSNKIQNIVKKGGKVLKNIGKRFLGPVGIGLTAYDIATTIPKVTKSTEEGLKERTKKETETGFTNPGVRKI